MAARNTYASAMVVICFVVLLIGAQIRGASARAATLSPGTIVVGVTERLSSLDSRLIAVDPVTGATTIVSDDTTGTGPSLYFGSGGSFAGPEYISQESDGSLLVAAGSQAVGSYEARVYQVDPNTGDRTVIFDVTGTMSDVEIYAVRQVGNTIFAATNTGLETIDPTTNVATPFAVTGVTLAGPLGGFVNVGNEIFAAGHGYVYQIDATTGAASIVAGPPVSSSDQIIVPSDLTFDPFGNLYGVGVITQTQGVFRIDPTTGNATPISTSPFPSGPPGVGAGPDIAALSIGAAPSGALYALNAAGSLLSIDPTTGNRTVLSQIESDPATRTLSLGLVVLHSVPEPATFILAGLGGLALFAMHRRR